METQSQPPAFDGAPESLLAEADFVRALARRLVFDEHDADDLAQNALAKSVASPPHHPTSRRHWFAKVMRNAAIERLRAKARTRRIEEDASRGEELPSTDSIVARESVRRAVVEALLELDEPYRSALVLRFYEELPPREVARRLKVPVETARTRIKRGLQRIRERLDQRSGDCTTWMSALLAWLEPGAAPRALPRRGFNGSAPLWIGFATIVAGFCAWRLAARPELATSLAEARTVTSSALIEPVAPEDSRRGAAAATAPNSAAEVRAPKDESSTVRGSIFARDGTPIANAEVLAFAEQHPLVQVGSEPQVIARAQSRADGEFELPGLPGAFTLWARASGLASIECVSVFVTPSSLFQNVRLELRPTRTFGGCLVDELGRPVPEVELVALPNAIASGRHPSNARAAAYAARIGWRTRSDASGRFVFAEVPDCAYTVAATKPQRSPAILARRGETELRIELASIDADRALEDLPLRSVRGRVVDGRSGTPVPWFDAALIPADERSVGTDGLTRIRGAEGEFELSGRGELWLLISNGERARAFTRVDGGGPLEIKLWQKRALTVRFVDRFGAPVAGAALRAYDSADRALFVPSGGSAWCDVVRTDTRGEVALLAVPSDRIRLALTTPSDARPAQFELDLAAPSSTRVVELSVDRPTSRLTRRLAVELRDGAAADWRREPRRADSEPLVIAAFEGEEQVGEIRGSLRRGRFEPAALDAVHRLDLDARGVPSDLRQGVLEVSSSAELDEPTVDADGRALFATTPGADRLVVPWAQDEPLEVALATQASRDTVERWVVERAKR